MKPRTWTGRQRFILFALFAAFFVYFVPRLLYFPIIAQWPQADPKPTYKRMFPIEGPYGRVWIPCALLLSVIAVPITEKFADEIIKDVIRRL